MVFAIRFYLFVLVTSLASAYPQFTNPSAGVSVPGGVTFTVSWADSGGAPAIADLTTYQLFLYSGSNSNPQQLYSVSNGAYASGNSISATVPVAVGGSMTNAYFLGLVSTAKSGGTFTSFSKRFTLAGMTGTFSPAVLTALEQVSDSAEPPVINNVAAAAANPARQISDEEGWEIPYNLQTGLIKYAPMQPIPPTAITAVNTKPLWPTSSVVLAKGILPIPSQVTTHTQSQTYSQSSHANTATPAPQPNDDMQKFLNRWKD